MNKNSLQVICCLLLCLSNIECNANQKWETVETTTPTNVQENEVLLLLGRLLPKGASKQFSIHIESNFAPKNKDKVHITTGNGTVKVTANTGVAASWGIYNFLTYYCNSHITWDTRRIEWPSTVPKVNLTLVSSDKFRYYQNVCTPGYSFAFWKWPDWESHIDWMALNGVNMPLAFTAQEAIWIRVYEKFGLTEKDLASHFAGPAFLPWQRMGNMESFGGPLPPSWHNYTLTLQHQILDRMRGLGMTTVLPAFAGHVPQKLLQLYPNATYTKQYWNGFPPTTLLEANDPLFQSIGTAFIQAYKSEFGSDHMYNCDVFNEMVPSNGSTEYLADSGRAVYQAMEKADPDAVWVMQGWLFLESYWEPQRIEALLKSVETGHMILLDLESTFREQFTRTYSYYGQPFIFNDLTNFGGSLGLFGRLGTINNRTFTARHMKNSTMIGTGFTPEGLTDSYIATELMSEMSWRSEPVPQLYQWVSDYATRRYGKANMNATLAWTTLLSHVFNSTVDCFNRKVLLTKMPSLESKDYMWYTLNEVAQGWDYLLDAADSLGHVDGYQFDLVDFTRQYLVNLAARYQTGAVTAYYMHNSEKLRSFAKLFLDLLTDLDAVLATKSYFLLGNWLEQAKSIPGASKAEQALYEFNARNQITLWGPEGQIIDYAAKEWSGLVSDYYAPRWMLFFSQLDQSIVKGSPFNQTDFEKDFMENIGKPFTYSRNTYPTKPTGNPVDVVRQVHKKWRPKLELTSYLAIDEEDSLKDFTPDFLENLELHYM